MDRFQDFDVILVSNKGFVPWVIRKFTKSKWNHVAMIVEVKNTLMVAEALNRGFIISKTLDDYMEETQNGKRGIKVIRRNDKTFDPKECAERFVQILGKKYEFKNLVIYQSIKSITGRYRGTTDYNKVICSEAIGYTMKKIFPNWYSIDPEDINQSPYFSDVYEWQ